MLPIRLPRALKAFWRSWTSAESAVHSASAISHLGIYAITLRPSAGLAAFGVARVARWISIL